MHKNPFRSPARHGEYSLEELNALPTISSSQGDDLKIDKPHFRLWISREEYPEVFEEYHNGKKWIVGRRYHPI